MARAITLEARQAVIQRYLRGDATMEEVARRCGVSRASLTRWLKRHRAGQDLAPQPNRGGKRAALGEDVRRALWELHQQHPQASTRQLQELVKERTGQDLSAVTVRRCLRRPVPPAVPAVPPPLPIPENA